MLHEIFQSAMSGGVSLAFALLPAPPLPWNTKPSWVVISANDRMLPPAMEEAAAKRMGAKATTLPTCHLAMLEDPTSVAQ